MSQEWFRATHPDGHTLTGWKQDTSSNGAGISLNLGLNSSAFLNYQDGWTIEGILGPVDPESPLGVAIAAYWDDFRTTDMDEPLSTLWYQRGYIDMVTSIAERVGVLYVTVSVHERRIETIQILEDNKPKEGES